MTNEWGAARSVEGNATLAAGAALIPKPYADQNASNYLKTFTRPAIVV
jgi:hypothetical protein